MPPYFLSFHPAIRMEENLPLFEPIDVAPVQRLIQEAVGVILPGYISPWRYREITRWACDWFPRLETRFTCVGKVAQIRLFRELDVRHPESRLFDSTPELLAFFRQWGSPWGYPLVLKGDRGGGGSTVFPIYSPADISRHCAHLSPHEPALLQQWIVHGGRDLRVVIYGDFAVSYFRMGDGRFYNNVCRGGRLDHEAYPEDQQRGIEAVQNFCQRSKIDIAGFDLMFPDDGPPVFVEINFHFGRKGLGGSAGHYRYVRRAVDHWIAHRLSKCGEARITT
ncbi:RimK family alpha-L-glutamate ligase [Desulforhabdus sp. TSK]|uniref:ATP-grasp domain-containing protein n=1 Tax=Desulforhabdus sp. TSK TaxID=2925014 RepID=UPI001FC891B4|nr:hypothetical protein [Desulforhabdus sp. TSK]GKT08296.1 hypothetical protein DSTSK_16010 [Desulforhabdus sp. TSK]